MREPEDIEAELMEIAALADDETKLNAIISWCATHADEIPFAIHVLMGGKAPTGQIAGFVTAPLQSRDREGAVTNLLQTRGLDFGVVIPGDPHIVAGAQERG